MSDQGHHKSGSREATGAFTARYSRYVGLLAIVLLVLILLNTITTKPNGSRGIAPGSRLPAFAVPLATGTLNGDADVATRANERGLGRVPACQERGPEILNICELYERGPVVLVLFVNGGDCTRVLDTLSGQLSAFPGLQVAAVSIKGDRAALRRLVAARGWRFPVGYDRDGVLANLYRDIVCPQLTFAYPGGIAQGDALLREPSAPQLRARLELLVSQSRARGWRPPA
jgi:hypothetical protein